MSDERKHMTKTIDVSAIGCVGEDNAHAIEKCATMIAERLLEDVSKFESKENYDKVREAIEWDVMGLIEWLILHPEFNRVETILGGFIGIAIQYNHSDFSYEWRFQAKLASMLIDQIVDNELEQAIEEIVSKDAKDEEKNEDPSSADKEAKSN